MSRTTINVVESNEEYMMEEPIEHHNSAEKDLESPDVHEITTNDEEGFTNCDDVDANETEYDQKQQKVLLQVVRVLRVVGTKVFLKSVKKHNRDVALATIMSCDPKFKLDGAEIANEFWAMHVDMALVETENLV
ncbi:hypothetical protein D1007_46404 [Hordeum vulgare]|nr:hypothetical protein D1007_46404 [Hordeum vulgare]